MLKVEGITKYYKDKCVLEKVSFDVKAGEIVGLVGPNGVGKTTLIKSVCGITNLKSGQAFINEEPLLMPPYTGRYLLGCAFQDNIFDRFFTIKDTILHNAMYHGMNLKEAKQATERILRKLQLYEKKNCYGHELSGGMKRRFQIALALVHNPSLLILDEPTAGLDLEVAEDIHMFIKNFVTAGDRAIMLTSHNITELSLLCTRVLFLKAGTIIQEIVGEKVKFSLEDEYRRIYMHEKE